ncbi:MAG: type III ribulose-bisphosphate carboxylase [Candidatus Woesearchaeota archaeon]|nr:type III ribulose-bisphosphate carboxylase [Candidatus Woesearchaeota archaeon]
MSGYYDLSYVPKKNEIICEFYIEPNHTSFENACEQVAAESSIGTWTDISTMRREIAEQLSPHVFYSDKKAGIARISYPDELFEPGNMPQILSSIAGNIFGMKVVKNLRLLDIHFPQEIIKSFRGPKYGINEIRKSMNIEDRPMLGTIIKPKVGLDSAMHAQVAYNAWVGGCDVVKDDENLTNQSFNPFAKRIVETLRKRNAAEKYTGERKIYLANVTAETREMIKRAKFVKRHGGEFVMIDVLTAGFSAVQTLREMDLGVAIHAHRAMHAAITRNPRHGIAMLPLAKIYRLIGVDSLHIGTAVGKMEGRGAEVSDIEEEIEGKSILERKTVLSQEWGGIKPVLAVCSGGLYPGVIPELMRIMGKDILIQAGGGIHGHPDGTTAGAKAMRQAIFASQLNYPLKKYAKENPELRKAIDKWGVGKRLKGE